MDQKIFVSRSYKHSNVNFKGIFFERPNNWNCLQYFSGAKKQDESGFVYIFPKYIFSIQFLQIFSSCHKSD